MLQLSISDPCIPSSVKDLFKGRIVDSTFIDLIFYDKDNSFKFKLLPLKQKELTYIKDLIWGYGNFYIFNTIDPNYPIAWLNMENKSTEYIKFGNWEDLKIHEQKMKEIYDSLN